MTKYDELLANQKQKLLKALSYLEYSYNKIINLPDRVEELDNESLETWESFAARFARVADFFLTRYLRSYVLNNDPGFTGSLRDFVNQAEKLGLIDHTETWMSIRELRNVAAHEYSEKDLSTFFQKLKEGCPKLLKISEKI